MREKFYETLINCFSGVLCVKHTRRRVPYVNVQVVNCKKFMIESFIPVWEAGSLSQMLSSYSFQSKLYEILFHNLLHALPYPGCALSGFNNI